MTRTYTPRGPCPNHISILRTLQSLGPCAQESIMLHTGIARDTTKRGLHALKVDQYIAYQDEPNKFEPCIYRLTPKGQHHLDQNNKASDVWSTPRKYFPRVASVWELGRAAP